MYQIVKRLFLEEQWSPEEISSRLSLEGYPTRIRYNTIYRAIYARKFDEKVYPMGTEVALENSDIEEKYVTRKTNKIHEETFGFQTN